MFNTNAWQMNGSQVNYHVRIWSWPLKPLLPVMVYVSVPSKCPCPCPCPCYTPVSISVSRSASVREGPTTMLLQLEPTAVGIPFLEHVQDNGRPYTECLAGDMISA